jgi:hypothetical protein
LIHVALVFDRLAEGAGVGFGRIPQESTHRTRRLPTPPRTGRHIRCDTAQGRNLGAIADT